MVRNGSYSLRELDRVHYGEFKDMSSKDRREVAEGIRKRGISKKKKASPNLRKPTRHRRSSKAEATKDFACAFPDCPFGPATAFEVQRHESSCHPNFCFTCAYCLPDEAALKKHNLFEHGKKCETCKKIFSTQKGLTAHQRYNKEDYMVKLVKCQFWNTAVKRLELPAERMLPPEMKQKALPKKRQSNLLITKRKMVHQHDAAVLITHMIYVKEVKACLERETAVRSCLNAMILQTVENVN